MKRLAIILILSLQFFSPQTARAFSLREATSQCKTVLKELWATPKAKGAASLLGQAVNPLPFLEVPLPKKTADIFERPEPPKGWGKLRKGFKFIKNVALTVSLAAVLNLGSYLAHGNIATASYLNDSAYKIQATQVQLIEDTLPFPHLAMRIGNTVYSYGISQLKAVPVPLYLGHRSVEVVTLNLNPEEVRELRAELEMSRYKTYKNVTAVNDCATMAMGALERHSAFHVSRALSSSPSQVMLYFAMLKTVDHVIRRGDNEVGPIYHVNFDSKTSSRIMESLLVNSLDSKIFISNFALNQVSHLGFDIKNRPASLQWQSAQTQRQIFEVVKKAQAEVLNDLVVVDIQRKIGEGANKNILRDELNNYLLEKVELSKSQLQAEDLDFWDITYLTALNNQYAQTYVTLSKSLN